MNPRHHGELRRIAMPGGELIIGDTDLMVVWAEYAFDPNGLEIFYAHVLKITTPRRTTFDAVRNGAKLEEEIPLGIEERAYTSPFWC
ncbi:MAG: DUF3604 domain-containing protein, partial [Verrucomicrobiales bacterium]|nr:DUF3604 domain-containing protein [Verrucomicrobiales bacterium]